MYAVETDYKHNNPLPDGQRFEEGFHKVFFRSISTEANVVVCHGNIIRYFICRFVVYCADLESTLKHFWFALILQVFASTSSSVAEIFHTQLLNHKA